MAGVTRHRFRRAGVAVGLAAVVSLVGSAAVGAPGEAGVPAVPEGGFHPSRVLVRYQPGAGREVMRGLEASVGAQRVETISEVTVLSVPTGRVLDAVEVLEADPAVVYAEPDNYLHPLADRRFPDDPEFGDQWGLHNTGQANPDGAGTPGADVDAPEGWAVETGSASVVVGVIDTGFGHEDLIDNRWRNPGGVNGCPKGSDGWNTLTDQCGAGSHGDHGTSVAGVAGAVGGNGLGVAGVAWDVSLMNLRVDLYVSSSALASHFVEAIDWAVRARRNHDVNVRALNISYGSENFSQAVADKIEEAGREGILVVAGSGNNSWDVDEQPIYPCAYPADTLTCVGGTTNRDELIYNWGSETVDLLAPARWVEVLGSSGSYRTNGTSLSAPFVTGTAALVWSRQPGLTPEQVKAKILAGVDRIPAAEGKTVSGGRLNVYGALTAPTPPPSTTTTTTTATGPAGGGGSGSGGGGGSAGSPAGSGGTSGSGEGTSPGGASSSGPERSGSGRGGADRGGEGGDASSPPPPHDGEGSGRDGDDRNVDGEPGVRGPGGPVPVGGDPTATGPTDGGGGVGWLAWLIIGSLGAAAWGVSRWRRRRSA